MGIIALGFGFGGPLGIAGALYHMLNHSLNKSAMFFGAGAVMRAYRHQAHRGHPAYAQAFSLLGSLWLMGAVAITGAPPFGLFLSELAIIRAGLAASQTILIGLMAILLIVIFVGFLNQFRIMYFEDGESNDPDVRAVTPWMVAPMMLAIVPLLVMGLWWPQTFWDLFQTIALSLGAPTATGMAP